MSTDTVLVTAQRGIAYDILLVMQWMIAYFLFGAMSGILLMHAPRLNARIEL
jgi:hypothetical protein